VIPVLSVRRSTLSISGHESLFVLMKALPVPGISRLIFSWAIFSSGSGLGRRLRRAQMCLKFLWSTVRD